MLLPTLNSSIGSFIGGFQDTETRVSVKFSLIYVALVQKNTWSKTLYYLLLILNQKTSCIEI